MSKPTYYLWRTAFQTEEEFIRVKAKYKDLGFRVVIYLDGSDEKDIHDGIRALIQNHLKYENV